ncbi:hypothetical protein Tco_0898857 [Tanacetum coccineum]
MLKTIIHAQTIQKRSDDKKLQIQECTVQEVKASDAILEDKAQERCMVSYWLLYSHLKLLSNNDLKGTRIKYGFKRAFATLFGQDLETFTDTIKQWDRIVKHDTSSSPGNDVDVDDAYIKPVYDEEPMAEVQLTAEINILATGQQHTKQPEFNNEGKPRFASQVDVNNDLSKPVTTHYLPKEREFAVVKPHHVIASSKSRNSSKNMPRFSSNDMVYNHYLDEAKKKTQERGRNSIPSVMPSARSTSTSNGSKPKPMINNQNSGNWLVSKSSCLTTKTAHSRTL